MNSDGNELPIDYRRIRLPSGQFNLSKDFPQNSFPPIAAHLAGGSDRLSHIDAVRSSQTIPEFSGVVTLIEDAQFTCLHWSETRFSCL
jgi:hypothetical protein